MIPDNFSIQRAPSQVITDPSNDYASWLADWQKRYDAEKGRASGGTPGGMSVPNVLSGITGDYVNSYMAGPDYANAVNTWSGLAYDPSFTGNAGFMGNNAANLNDTYGHIFQDAYNVTNGLVTPGTGGRLSDGLTADWVTQAAQDALGSGLYGALTSYAPSEGSPGYTPDFTALNAEKAKKENEFSLSINNQKSRQNAYTNQLGGGFVGGVLPDATSGAAFSIDPASMNMGSAQSTGTTGQDPISSAIAPWATPSYSNGGLGGLGGYNPNPWNTSNPNASSGANPWGGPFGARNPFSPGG